MFVAGIRTTRERANASYITRSSLRKLLVIAVTSAVELGRAGDPGWPRSSAAVTLVRIKAPRSLGSRSGRAVRRVVAPMPVGARARVHVGAVLDVGHCTFEQAGDVLGALDGVVRSEHTLA